MEGGFSSVKFRPKPKQRLKTTEHNFAGIVLVDQDEKLLLLRRCFSYGFDTLMSGQYMSMEKFITIIEEISESEFQLLLDNWTKFGLDTVIDLYINGHPAYCRKHLRHKFAEIKSSINDWWVMMVVAVNLPKLPHSLYPRIYDIPKCHDGLNIVETIQDNFLRDVGEYIPLNVIYTTPLLAEYIGLDDCIYKYKIIMGKCNRFELRNLDRKVTAEWIDLDNIYMLPAIRKILEKGLCILSVMD